MGMKKLELLGYSVIFSAGLAAALLFGTAGNSFMPQLLGAGIMFIAAVQIYVWALIHS